MSIEIKPEYQQDYFGLSDSGMCQGNYGKETLVNLKIIHVGCGLE